LEATEVQKDALRRNGRKANVLHWNFILFCTDRCWTTNSWRSTILLSCDKTYTK